MRSRLGLGLACAVGLSGAGCKRAGNTVDSSGVASGGAASSTASVSNAVSGGAGAALGRSSAAAPSSSAAGPTTSADERARELCHVLQGGPAERRAACCGGRPSGHVESACVRDLSLALTAGRVEIDSARLDSCTVASARALEGCDWVTPGQPVPPPECQGLVVGRVALGGVCRSSLECQGQLHCEGSTPTQGGRCAAPKAPPAPCAPAADGLATYLFARDLEREHPTCTGTCSLLTHRCEAAPATRTASRSTTASRPGASDAPASDGAAAAGSATADTHRGRGSKRAGEACQTDFDCSQGGCNGNPGICGMKCAVSLADQARFKGLSPLSLPNKPGEATPAARSLGRSTITER